MRKTIVLLTSMALVVLLVSGVALAATISCAGGERWCSGTEGDDTITGTPGFDQISGKGGNDTIYGLKGPDRLVDKAGRNRIYGGVHGDLIGNAKGRIVGGPGEDKLGSRGTGSIGGGPGDDNISAYNGARNKIYCGPGKDTVYFDRNLDVLKGCEERIPHAPPLGG